MIRPSSRITSLGSLNTHGYTALAVYGPLEALAYATEIYFDCAFIGVDMPVMNGPTLAVQVQELLPQCRIILGIEQLRAIEQEALFLTNGFGFLPAPFTTEELLRKIETPHYDCQRRFARRPRLLD